jgi:hypothetical protein
MAIEIEAGAIQLQKNLRRAYGGCSRCPQYLGKTAEEVYHVQITPEDGSFQIQEDVLAAGEHLPIKVEYVRGKMHLLSGVTALAIATTPNRGSLDSSLGNDDEHPTVHRSADLSER